MQNTDEAAPVISVHGVYKSFQLPHQKSNSLKGALLNFRQLKQTYEKQSVLKDISFEIRKGEFFGIVGRNGSGKSTLLKLLAGIYYPNKGAVQVNGKLTPFIELGVGFNPELTGRENVFLNGALLGFTRKEMALKYQSIVDFAELERFMDQKLKNYSSGMQVRLAFSIAIQTGSEILLFDEVLAVGDLDFQKKCYTYFHDMKRSGQTIVLVTHDMAAVRRFCTRCALIDQGKIVSIGEPEDIAYLYETINLRASEVRLDEANKVIKQKRQGTYEAVIDSVETYNPHTGNTQNTFTNQEKIGVRITYSAKSDIENAAVGFIFQNQDDLTVFATNNITQEVKIHELPAGSKMSIEAEIDNVFTDGEYTITTSIENKELEKIYDRIEYAHRFMVGGQKLSHALAHPHHQMKVSYGHTHHE